MEAGQRRRVLFGTLSLASVVVGVTGWFPLVLSAALAMGTATESTIAVVLGRLMAALDRWLEASEEAVLDAFRIRDALLGREICWQQGAAGELVRQGRAAGIDGDGRLQVQTGDGETLALDSGEVHLTR